MHACVVSGIQVEYGDVAQYTLYCFHGSIPCTDSVQYHFEALPFLREISSKSLLTSTMT